MGKLTIEWKHFDKEGRTCDRCSGTRDNLMKAIEEIKKELKPEVDIIFKETKLTQDRMSESNEVIIGGTNIEDLIPGVVSGENECPSCSTLIDGSFGCRCRTLVDKEDVMEEIPAEIIKKAVLNKIGQDKNKTKNMKIQVLGAGCPSCKKLFELTKRAVDECGIEAEVEYVSDIQKIIETGAMSAPVLVIDGKVAVAGSVPDIEELKEIINGGASNIEERPGCDCGGKC